MIKNHRTTWQLFRQVYRADVPTFHKKQTTQKYQTSCQYAQQVQVPNMLIGNFRLLDKIHLRLPKTSCHVFTTLIKNHDLVVAEELRSKSVLQN